MTKQVSQSAPTSPGLNLRSGEWVLYGQRMGRIQHIPNLREAMLQDERGERFTALLHHLTSLEPVQATPPDPRALDSAARQQAQRQAEFRLEVITPLLALGPERTEPQVYARAQEFGLNGRNVYRWILSYERDGFAALVRKPRSNRGKRTLDQTLDTLIETLIQNRFLTDDRPALTRVYETLLLEVDAINRALPQETAPYRAPAFSTFRRRVYEFSEQKRLSRRLGPRAARVLAPAFGETPGAIHPLSEVQIDHNLLDLIVVDRVRRQPLGRPWLTLVTDAFSRCVLGYYVSLESPGAFSVGQALAHAILPKEGWLAQSHSALEGVLSDLSEVGAKLEWPCWGKPATVKMDNAREFRGRLLESTLQKYGITREFRRVKQPWDSGGVERLFGTLNTRLKALPGATFSSPKERGDYDSQAKSALSLEALEIWLAAYLLGIYHKELHSSLGMTPLARWEQGLLHGTDKAPPTGLPERLGGDRAARLKLDFLPFFEATVQRGGIRHQTLTYNGEAVRRFVGARHPDYPTRARSFRIAYDPRDISRVYFLDPDLDHYFEVRCRQPDFPAMSVWELRATRAYARKQHLEARDEREIMNVYRLMNRLVAQEQKDTLAARVQSERERGRARVKEQKPAGAVSVREPSSELGALNLFSGMGEIEPFEGIEMS